MVLSTAAPTMEISNSVDHRINTTRIQKPWVDPQTLPDYGDASSISGSASYRVKQLTANTLAAYGIGSSSCFAHSVGKALRLTDVSIERMIERMGRAEATTVAEVVVSKGQYSIVDRVIKSGSLGWKICSMERV
jgi:acyl-coenzyme A thioesterase 13